MGNIWAFAGVVILGQTLAGCGSHLFGGDAVDVHSVDASSKDGAVIHHRDDGGTAYVFSQGGVQRHICAMPPASAARELAQALSAEVKETGKIELSSDEKTRALYEQSDRVLFLQFAFYRLCESRANGNFAPPTGCEVVADRVTLLAQKLIAAEEARSKAELVVDTAEAEKREPKEAELASVRSTRLVERQLLKDWTRAIAHRNACQQGSYEETFVKILDTAVKISTQSTEPEKKKSKAKPKKKRRPAKEAAPKELGEEGKGAAQPAPTEGVEAAAPKGAAPKDASSRGAAPKGAAPKGKGGAPASTGR